jgi:hypothetical protein
MIIVQNVDGSFNVVLDVPSSDPGNIGPATLTIPAGTPAHAAYQQVLAFCIANGVRVIPQFVLINPSGTTGTVIS